MKKYQAKIDLHGYTLQQGYEEFVGFVDECIEAEVDTILVVTGKGNELSGRETINTEFPHWCESRDLKSKIRFCKNAEERDGGKGAFYVGVIG